MVLRAFSRWRIVTVTCIVALMVVGTGACQDATDLQTLGSELDAIAAENHLIENLNDLQLSAVQIKALLDAIKELQAATDAVRQERIGVLNELKPLLLKQREALMRDEPPAAILREQIKAEEDKLRELDDRMNSTLAGVAPKFREILTGPQLSIITGAEEARLKVADLLEWVRELDDDGFAREARPYAEELADPELGLAADQIMQVFDTARKMSGADYKVKGPDIWRQLTPLFMPTASAADYVIGSFFAQPTMTKVLQEKLNTL